MLETQFHLTELRCTGGGDGLCGSSAVASSQNDTGAQGFGARGEEGTNPGDISNFFGAKMPFGYFLQLLTDPRMKKTIGASSPG